MAKNNPIITHTEILCLAIQSVSRKLHEYDMVDKSDNLYKQEMFAAMRETHESIWAPKLAALKELYKIETGTDFGDT